MSVTSDLTPSCLTQFVLCFPIGVTPEGVEPTSEFCQYEEYDIQFCEQPPQVGDLKTFDFDPSSWTIADVHLYESSGSSHQIKTVYTAVCTQGGEMPNREHWHTPSILYIPALSVGKLITREDGSGDWGITNEAGHIPSRFDGLRRADLQWFEPVNMTPDGFRAIALCWCFQERAIAA
jgi:hypothetical protein